MSPRVCLTSPLPDPWWTRVLHVWCGRVCLPERSAKIYPSCYYPSPNNQPFRHYAPLFTLLHGRTNDKGKGEARQYFRMNNHPGLFTRCCAGYGFDSSFGRRLLESVPNAFIRDCATHDRFESWRILSQGKEAEKWRVIAFLKKNTRLTRLIINSDYYSAI